MFSSDSESQPPLQQEILSRDAQILLFLRSSTLGGVPTISSFWKVHLSFPFSEIPAYKRKTLPEIRFCLFSCHTSDLCRKSPHGSGWVFSSWNYFHLFGDVFVFRGRNGRVWYLFEKYIQYIYILVIIYIYIFHIYLHIYICIYLIIIQLLLEIHPIFCR